MAIILFPWQSARFLIDFYCTFSVNYVGEKTNNLKQANCFKCLQSSNDNDKRSMIVLYHIRVDPVLSINMLISLCLDIKLNDRILLADIHKRANLISLEQRRCIQLLSLLFQHGELNVFEHPVRNTRAANVRKFKTEMYQNTKCKNSPYYKSAKFSDTLPTPAKDSETLIEFKRHLRRSFPDYDDTFYLV